MALFGMELAAGLSAALGLTFLAVLWNYSTFGKVRWTEITAGVMAFVTAAGVDLLVGDTGLGEFANTANLDFITAIVVIIGGLLVVVGGVRNVLDAFQ